MNKLIGKTLFLSLALCAFSSNSFGDDTLEELKKLKPLDSSAFKLLSYKKVDNHYLVNSEMTYRGQHRLIDVFVTSDKKYVAFGNIFDTKSGKEISSVRKIKTTKVKDYKYNPEKLKALAAYKIGEGKNVYYLFTDFDCPFCQRLEKKLKKLREDVAVYILPYPLERLHPHSKAKALLFMEMSESAKKEIIEGNKGLAAINTQHFLPKKETIEKLKQIKKEASKAHLTGTPFLIGKDGKRVIKILKDGRKIPDYSRILRVEDK